MAAGDGAAWSLLFQRVILTTHRGLDAVLLGLEDQALATAARSVTLLFPCFALLLLLALGDDGGRNVESQEHGADFCLDCYTK